MRHKLLILIVCFFTLLSCKKQKQQTDNWFLIEIKSPSNFDCKLPEIIFIERQREAYEIIGNNGGIYIANGLPKILFTVGQRMYVSIQRPDAYNTVACTTAGPGYYQVIITSVK